MVGGLAQSSRDWYCEHILEVLRKHKKASIQTIIDELRHLKQNRYPLQEERVVHFLKYLKAIGLVKYHKSLKRKVPSNWEVSSARRNL